MMLERKSERRSVMQVKVNIPVDVWRLAHFYRLKTTTPLSVQVQEGLNQYLREHLSREELALCEQMLNREVPSENSMAPGGEGVREENSLRAPASGQNGRVLKPDGGRA